MRIGILTIGDELLLGQVINSNAAFIADCCTKTGAQVVMQSTVADATQAIVNELGRMVDDGMDAVITTGGLGPTHDDCTVAAITEFANVGTHSDPRWHDHLQRWMASLGRELSPRNATQAIVPDGSAVFYSSVGTAPGFMVMVTRNEKSCMLFVLPGVPREMHVLMHAEVEPRLQEYISRHNQSVCEYRTIIAMGIPESTLADYIGNPDEFLRGATLAFLPSAGGVRLRIGVTGIDTMHRKDELDRIEALLQERAGKWIIGNADVLLQERIGDTLLASQHTVAVAESCTGGLLGAAFTDVPGSSRWFEGGVITYSNTAKVRDLGVSETALTQHGAVSQIVAEQMASGVRQRFGTTFGIGITGVAGPDGGTPEKPVGTVWIALATPSAVEAHCYHFSTSRSHNRERSVAAALLLLWKAL